MIILPVSGIIPTRDRASALSRMLDSLSRQSACPAELIVVDASNDDATKNIVAEFSIRTAGWGSRTRWQAAEETGAAVQRNQAIRLATQPVIAFFDDDIVFEEECLARLWSALQSDPRIGGVNAMIAN